MNEKLAALAMALILLVVGICLWRWNQYQNETPNAAKYEKPFERWKRQGEEAQAELTKAATNSVIGFYRLVDISCSTSDDDVAKWRGRATVEYLANGGAVRTNLYFKFKISSGSPYCWLVTEKEFSK